MAVQNVEADPTWKAIALSFRHLSQRELAGFAESHWKHGWKWTTIIADMHMYMAYLLQRFQNVS